MDRVFVQKDGGEEMRFLRLRGIALILFGCSFLNMQSLSPAHVTNTHGGMAFILLTYDADVFYWAVHVGS